MICFENRESEGSSGAHPSHGPPRASARPFAVRVSAKLFYQFSHTTLHTQKLCGWNMACAELSLSAARPPCRRGARRRSGSLSSPPTVAGTRRQRARPHASRFRTSWDDEGGVGRALGKWRPTHGRPTHGRSTHGVETPVATLGCAQRRLRRSERRRLLAMDLREVCVPGPASIGGETVAAELCGSTRGGVEAAQRNPYGLRRMRRMRRRLGGFPRSAVEDPSRPNSRPSLVGPPGVPTSTCSL